MLLKTYTKEIFRPECNPSFQSLHCIAHLGEDVREALPYLNAVLGGFEYLKDPPAVTFRVQGKIITVHPREIQPRQTVRRGGHAIAVDGEAGFVQTEHVRLIVDDEHVILGHLSRRRRVVPVRLGQVILDDQDRLSHDLPPVLRDYLLSTQRANPSLSRGNSLLEK